MQTSASIQPRTIHPKGVTIKFTKVFLGTTIEEVAETQAFIGDLVKQCAEKKAAWAERQKPR